VRLSFAIDEDVSRRQIAMEDAEVVRAAERARDPREGEGYVAKVGCLRRPAAIRADRTRVVPASKRHELGDRPRSVRHGASRHLREGRAVHELHRDEVIAVALPALVNADDGRVIDGTRGSGFLNEALDAAGPQGEIAGEHLERHHRRARLVRREEHDAHPAATEPARDPIGADLLGIAWIRKVREGGRRLSVGAHASRSPRQSLTCDTAPSQRGCERSGTGHSGDRVPCPPDKAVAQTPNARVPLLDVTAHPG
jgi:hypothetical protein